LEHIGFAAPSERLLNQACLERFHLFGRGLVTEAPELARLGSGMKFILSTHNVTLTDAIEQHILSRIEKLDHMDQRAISARVTLEHDHQKVPERQFKCSMRIEEPGPDLFAEDSESDLYAAIDLVAKKIEQQMRKRRGKFKVRNHNEAAKGKRLRQDTEK
jgi:putative sigma-54 modulation protein